MVYVHARIPATCAQRSDLVYWQKRQNSSCCAESKLSLNFFMVLSKEASRCTPAALLLSGSCSMSSLAHRGRKTAPMEKSALLKTKALVVNSAESWE